MSARSSLGGWLSSPPPSVAVEIGARRVTAVALGSSGGRPAVTAHATEALPDGLVTPSQTGTNLPDRGAVTAALVRVLGALGTRARRVALVLPDGAAKVSLVKFDKLPEKAADLEQLVRWQVKKSVPFPLDQAQVSWTRGAPDGSGATECVVTVARRDVVAEYEGVCAAAGLHAGLVDLATFSLANAVLAGDRQLSGTGASGLRMSGNGGGSHDGPADAAPGDWLLVHVAPDSSTLVVVRGGDLIVFRNRSSEAEGSLEDLVHQTAMYYEDRLGGRGLARVFVTPRDLAPAEAEEVASMCRVLEARGSSRVEEIDIRAAAALTDRVSTAPDLLRALAAPVGVLLRERVS